MHAEPLIRFVTAFVCNFFTHRTKSQATVYKKFKVFKTVSILKNTCFANSFNFSMAVEFVEKRRGRVDKIGYQFIPPCEQ